MNGIAKSDLARARVRRFLKGSSAVVRQAARPNEVLLDGGDRGHIGVERGLLAAMLESRELVLSGETVRLADPAGLARRKGGEDGQTSVVQRERSKVASDGGVSEVLVNTAESPLASLWRHKGRNGERFLTASEFNAGERLRLDYTRGQIMPRLGINWSAAGSGGKKHRDTNGFGDMTDSALAARDRVEAAIEAVGPELSGVLIDVCCFLKGMEQVEAERGWPVRSGKVVLKSALSALARHYQPPQRTQRQKAILHWGSDDYRPQMGRAGD